MQDAEPIFADTTPGTHPAWGALPRRLTACAGFAILLCTSRQGHPSDRSFCAGGPAGLSEQLGAMQPQQLGAPALLGQGGSIFGVIGVGELLSCSARGATDARE